MLVSHINSFLDGGAATAARRLHAELLNAGIQSRFYYARHQGSRPELDATYQPAKWRHFGLNRKLASAIQFRVHRESFKRVLRDRPASHDVFSSPRGATFTPWPPVGHPTKEQDEVIHLHWISKFIDYDSFFGSLRPEQPVVWTLHDMNAFTGGCHFSEGCDHYQHGCGACSQLGDRSAEDVSHAFYVQKQAAIRNVNLHVAAPSRWLLSAARSSQMFDHVRSFSHVPYGVSTRDYYPMDRQEARARLGIDPKAMVVCFGAADVANQRKGAKHLLGALEAVADLPSVEALVFGSGQLPKTASPAPAIREVGPLSGLLQQRTVYSASDLFVLPSLEDNLPLTGMEAMACGTAVLAFETGGIPDYVRPNETGMLARCGDTADLGQKLRSLTKQPALVRAMGCFARELIEKDFLPEHESSAYQCLYTSLTEPVRSVQRRAA